MNNKESDKSVEVEEWEESEEVSSTQRRGSESPELSEVTGSDMQRLRKAIRDEKQILTLKKFNRVLMIFVVGILVFFEYRSGHIPKLFNKNSETKPPEIPEDKELSPEEDMVTYPYKEYLQYKSQALDDGHKGDIEQDSH